MNDELLLLGEELMHPKRGVMRGLYPTDGDRKLLRMNVGEVRRIARFISEACRALAPVDTDRQAETALAGSGRSLGSAVGEAEAPCHGTAGAQGGDA